MLWLMGLLALLVLSTLFRTARLLVPLCILALISVLLSSR